MLLNKTITMKTKRTIFTVILLLLISFAYAQNPNITLTDAFPDLTFTSALNLTHSGDGTNRIFVIQIILHDN